MRKEEFNTFTIYLTGVAETLGHVINANQIMMYFEVLRDEFNSIDDFKKASVELMKTWKYSYMPKPAHFLEVTFPQSDVEIVAQKAWNSVLFALENGVGSTKIAKFEDGLIPLIVENYIGGFKILGRINYKELEFKKKEFLKMYEILAKKKEVTLKDIDIKTIINNPLKIVITANYPVPKIKNDDATTLTNNKKTQKMISKMVGGIKF